MKHIMLDLETWDTIPSSAIRSIGACVFDPKTGEIGATFYANVDDASCEEFGLSKSEATTQWWADQAASAQDALEVDQKHLAEALGGFIAFWEANQGQYIWSHGANFDEVIIGCALAAVGLEKPWKFWDVRCSRTVLALGNRRAAKANHNALDDARNQAVAVAAALRQGIKF